MCAGPQFSGTFQNCDFKSSPIYVANGARATLTDCTAHAAQPALTLSGAGTSAHLSGCSIDSCFSSIMVDRGATVAAHNCWIEETDAAVVLCSAGGHASLDSCYLRGSSNWGSVGGLAVQVLSSSISRRASADTFHDDAKRFYQNCLYQFLGYFSLEIGYDEQYITRARPPLSAGAARQRVPAALRDLDVRHRVYW